MKTFLLALLALSLPLSASESRSYVRSDIPVVMDEIFNYHVQYQFFTTELAARSLHLYIKAFDPAFLYLQETEVLPYLRPSTALLERVVSEYKLGQFSVFSELDQLFVRAAVRAKQMREANKAGLAAIVAQVLSASSADYPQYVTFARSDAELASRIKADVVRFVSVQKYLGLDLKPASQKTLWDYYVRGLEDEEEPYMASDEHRQTERILKALSRSLDAHTSFYTDEEAFDLKNQLENSTSGVGILVEERADGVIVSGLIPDAPAHRSGLLAVQDRLVAVNGTNVTEKSLRKVLKLLRSEEGQNVVLQLRRSDQAITAILKSERLSPNQKILEVQEQPYRDGIVACISLRSFYCNPDGAKCSEDIKAALVQLKKKNLQGLILDLRENRGGFLLEAVALAGLFIKSGVIVTSKASDGSLSVRRDVDGESTYDGPLCILLSKASASATEIVAQTLRDYGRAILLGDEHTYGKGSIQYQTVTDPTATDFYKVTIGRYYTVSGMSPQLDGCTVDLIVPTSHASDQICEASLEFPLPKASIDPLFDDPLTDLDPATQDTYRSFYLPDLQKPTTAFTCHIPALKAQLPSCPEDPLEASFVILRSLCDLTLAR